MDDVGNPDNDMIRRQQEADRRSERRAHAGQRPDEDDGVTIAEANQDLREGTDETPAQRIEGDVRATGGLWSATTPEGIASTEAALRRASGNDAGDIPEHDDHAGPDEDHGVTIADANRRSTGT